MRRMKNGWMYTADDRAAAIARTSVLPRLHEAATSLRRSGTKRLIEHGLSVEEANAVAGRLSAAIDATGSVASTQSPGASTRADGEIDGWTFKDAEHRAARTDAAALQNLWESTLFFRHDAVNRLVGLGASLEITAELRDDLQHVLDDAHALVEVRELGPTQDALVERALDESGLPGSASAENLTVLRAAATELLATRALLRDVDAALGDAGAATLRAQDYVVSLNAISAVTRRIAKHFADFPDANSCQTEDGAARGETGAGRAPDEKP